jgi:hypothetical protein
MDLKDDAENLLKQYFDWLRDKTLLKAIDNEWVEITTPYLDRHNDCLQIYLRKDNTNFLLTDDGYILDDLMSSGCDLTTPRRKALLTTILNSFGVQLDEKNHHLTIHSSRQDFPFRKHNLIQAMLAVNDLFYLARSQVKNLFVEDVTHWFDFSQVRYIPMVSFPGKSGFNHRFDFAIPKSKNSPERLVQTINNPNKQTVLEAVFKWLDTREVRPESKLVTVLNDSSKAIPSNAIEAFEKYDLQTVLWSEKDKFCNVFVA